MRPTLALMALVFLASCTERIEIELDSTYDRLVVNGKLTTDSIQHQVRLTTTSEYFSNAPAPSISGAVVEIRFDDRSLVLEEQDSVPGLYLTPFAFRGVEETSYELRISNVDVDGDGVMEQYESMAVMPVNARLDSIGMDHFTSPFGSGYRIYMYALDPPGRNWYNLKFWKNRDLLTDTLIKYSVQSDDFYDEMYLFFGIPIGFYDDDNEREALLPGDTVTLELHGIEQAYYNFVIDAQLEIFGSNPLFSGPPANLRSNISNGAIGSFGVYSVARSSMIVPEGLK